MGFNNYRRTGPGRSAGAIAPDPADPYAAYVEWVAQGRPSLSGGSAVKPEAGTMTMADHVQVQQYSAVGAASAVGAGTGPDPTASPTASGSPSASPAAKTSPWKRLAEAFRRTTSR